MFESIGRPTSPLPFKLQAFIWSVLKTREENLKDSLPIRLNLKICARDVFQNTFRWFASNN